MIVKKIFLKLQKLNKYKFNSISWIRISDIIKGYDEIILDNALKTLPKKKSIDIIEDFKKTIQKVIADTIKQDIKRIKK